MDDVFVHLDLRVGFPVSSYAVDESVNLIVEVSVLADMVT